MVQTLRLTVLTGPHKNDKFCFCGPSQCLVGRSAECFVRLAGTERDQLISRRHCLLTIAPPIMKTLDLDSQNGTFINGQRVGCAAAASSTGNEDAGQELASTLSSGDLLTIGGTTFRVDLVDCPPTSCGMDESQIWGDGKIALRGCQVSCLE
jgi:hypothetical protein